MSASSNSHRISLLTATCIVIANMIGTGIFTSLGFQVGDLPSGFAIIAVWTVGGICAMCGALSYAELARSEEHTSELQSRENIVCRLLLEKKKIEHQNTQ